MVLSNRFLSSHSSSVSWQGPASKTRARAVSPACVDDEVVVVGAVHGVHKARVAAQRLNSLVRTYGAPAVAVAANVSTPVRADNNNMPNKRPKDIMDVSNLLAQCRNDSFFLFLKRRSILADVLVDGDGPTVVALLHVYVCGHVHEVAPVRKQCLHCRAHGG
jgi:hypothetical protein